MVAALKRPCWRRQYMLAFPGWRINKLFWTRKRALIWRDRLGEGFVFKWNNGLGRWIEIDPHFTSNQLHHM